MAKIENTTVYPTVTPAASDLLIATDVSDNNKTVTFLVSSITGGGGVAQDLQSVLDTGNTAIQSINLTGNINVTGTVYPTTITAIGSTGAAGQILSSTGTGLQWINAGSASCCSLDDTLTIGNTSSQDIILSSGQFQSNGVGGGVVISTPSVLTNSGTSSFTGQVNINSTTLNFNATALLNDGSGSAGTPGQFLTSTGTGVAWSSTLPPASCCGLQNTLSGGNTSTGQNVTLSGTGLWSFESNVSIESDATNIWNGINTFSATSTLDLDGPIEDSLGSDGLAGQVLSSTGTGVEWVSASAGSQDLQSVLDTGNTATGAAANITISGFIRPGQITDTSGATGSIGQVLTSTGTGLAWSSSSCCDLQDTLTSGNTAITNIILSGIGTNLTAPLVIPELIQDGTGATGAIGQVLGLNAGATAIEWVTNSASNSNGYVLTERFILYNNAIETGNIYTLNGIDNMSFAGVTSNLIGPNTVLNPSSNVLSEKDYHAGMFFKNTVTTCNASIDSQKICAIQLSAVSLDTATYKISFYKAPNICVASMMQLIGECEEFQVLSTDSIACCNVPLNPSNVNIDLSQGIYITLEQLTVAENPSVQLDVSIAFSQE